MAVSSEFRDFVLEQLRQVAPVRAKNMFGGVGLYAGELFFALIAGDVLYFKVDEASRSYFEAAGMNPFKPFRDRPSMSYYELPAEVLEDEEQLRIWTRRAITAAERKRKSSRKRAGKR